MTKEQAFKIIELDRTVSKDKIKARYENLMRDAKFNKSVDTELITEAYDIIMDVEWTGYDPSVYSVKGINKKKIINFIYYYKWHVLSISLIALILLTTTLLVIFGNPTPDYSITILGGTVLERPNAASDHYTELLDVDHVQLSIFTVGEFADGQVGLTGMNSLRFDLASGDSDIYLLSDDFAKFLSYEGAAKDLTPLLEKAGVPLTDENIIWWYNEDGEDIAAAYRYGSSDIISQCFSGFIPDCFLIPFRADFTELTDVMINDLICSDVD